MYRNLVLAILITLSASSYATYYMTGNIWNQMSNGQKQGYVMGVVDAFSTADSSLGKGTGFITECIPSTALSDQLVKIIGKYVRENPEKLHNNMDAIVSASISKAFPCSTK